MPHKRTLSILDIPVRQPLSILTPEDHMQRRLAVRKSIGVPSLPLVWERLSTGFRVQDLHEGTLPELLDLFKSVYLKEEIMCRSLNILEDQESVDCYMDFLRFWLNDRKSLVAVDDETGKVVGFLVARTISKLQHTRTYSRMRLAWGQSYDIIMSTRHQMHRECDIYEKFGVNEYLNIYAMAVLPQFRGIGIGTGLLWAADKLARLMHVPVVTGIFEGYLGQWLARKSGMDCYLKIKYDEWLTKDGDRIFPDTGTGNKSFMFMGKQVPVEVYETKKFKRLPKFKRTLKRE